MQAPSQHEQLHGMEACTASTSSCMAWCLHSQDEQLHGVEASMASCTHAMKGSLWSSKRTTSQRVRMSAVHATGSRALGQQFHTTLSGPPTHLTLT
mmetsp:Transcript_13102/g.38112  ORF Transcript_13102/g.38112 Transcript_13102/m.38112 type:complete len:96 (-) Transcript_13102:267-554(-)